MKETRGPARRRSALAIPLATLLASLCALLAATALAAPPAGAAEVKPFLEDFGSANQPGFAEPMGMAVDRSSGDLLVIDAGATEKQSVTVAASAGQFKLSFDGETTASLPFNASALEVREALWALPSLQFNVEVSGGPGNATGSSPYLISFQESLRFTAVEQIACEDGATPLSGGSGCAVATTVQGVPRNVSRWHDDGTPSDFPALGTNVIDGNRGPGGEPCAVEPASCDATIGGGVLGRSFDSLSPAGVQVAVDNSGAVTDGNIYVTNKGGDRIDVFGGGGEFRGQLTEYEQGPAADGAPRALGDSCGVAVDASGALYTGDQTNNLVHKFVPSAALPTATDNTANFASRRPCALAAGVGPSDGLLFVEHFTFREVNKLDSDSGETICNVDPGTVAEGGVAVTTLTVDPASGHLFLAKAGEAIEYDAAGGTGEACKSEVSTVEAGSSIQGLAAGSGGQLYLSRSGKSEVEVYGATVPPPVAVTEPAAPIGETSATLNGSADPEGALLQSCRFEYLSDAKYRENTQAKADPFAGAAAQPCAESPAAIGSGSEPVPVHADLSGLQAGTLYHFRLVLVNASTTGSGAERTFATRLPPELAAAWVVGTTHSEATLRAQIDPRHYPTSFHVEYGPTASYGQRSAELDVGSDGDLHTVTAILSGLQPRRTYHWRVVATSENGSTASPDGTFATYAAPGPPPPCANDAFRAGPSAALPDCRAYEMVSPVDKNGGDVVALPSVGLGSSGHYQAAASGERITYTSATAFGDAQRGAYANQYLATRGAGGWSSHGLNPPQGTTVFDAAGTRDLDLRANLDLNNAFHYFTSDLCFAVMIDQNFEPLTPDAIHGYTNAYLRDNCAPGAEGYEAITRGDPPSTSGFHEHLNLEVRNLTADRRYAVFRSKAALTPDAAPEPDIPNFFSGFDQLYIYDFANEQLRLVSTLPDGQASVETNVVGTGSTRNASTLERGLAEDGSALFWTAGSSAKVNDGGSLYVRENPAEAPSALDGEGNCTEADKACTIAIFEETSGAAARFWTADRDGRRAIFTAGDRVAAELYEFDRATRTTTEIAGQAGGVVGASDDLSHLYFTSKEAIAGSGENERGEEAGDGEWNLYLRRGGAVSFIATLAERDHEEVNPSLDAPRAGNHDSRVSPDGAHLTFMSLRSLTGYDNTDQASGEADREVFLYRAATEELICVSCNPSGARPQGRNLGAATEVGKRWTAAWLPGWEWSSYGKRALSEDGRRVFFNALDALVPADRNGAQDVYQWEAPGTGTCTTASVDYFSANEGCIGLISTGRGPKSELVDASADGGDVFIETAASIDPRDPGSIDIYDAREGGGFPLPPPPPPECAGDACQAVPAAPRAPAPNSASFVGAGNPRTAAGCRARARRAARLSQRGKRLRRRAARVSSPRRSRQLRHRSQRFAKKAKRLSRAAKRCRRANRRAGR